MAAVNPNEDSQPSSEEAKIMSCHVVDLRNRFNFGPSMDEQRRILTAAEVALMSGKPQCFRRENGSTAVFIAFQIEEGNLENEPFARPYEF